MYIDENWGYSATLKEAERLVKGNKKLRAYYRKMLEKWDVEEALLQTYDEWFYHQEQYE